MGKTARTGPRGTRRAPGWLALALVASTAGVACSSRPVEVAFEQRAAVVEGAGSVAVDDPATADLEQGGLIGGSGGSKGTSGRSGSGPGASASGSGGDGGSRFAKGVVKIGTILPLTGGQREFGEPILRVTQAYVDETNAAGGIGGYELQLVAYDACLTCQDGALAAAKRLVEQDGVFAIVNPYVMVIAFIPVVPYLDSHRVPLIQGGS